MPGLSFDQLRVKPMDVLMGRTRYDRMRTMLIGFGGAIIGLIVVILAMIGAMAMFAQAQGAEFEWGFFVPNRVTWCQGVPPRPTPTPAIHAASYHLPSPTGEGVRAALYMSSGPWEDGVGTPSLPTVGHPAGGRSTSSQITAGAVATGVAAAVAVLIALALRGLLGAIRAIAWALIAAGCFLLGAGAGERVRR